MQPWRTHEDVETMHQRRSIQRISGRHFWRNGIWTWYLVPLLPRKRHPSVDVAYRNYAQVLWQLLMKETRFVPSMMDLGEVQMPTSRPTPTNALQPPQSWTASTAFTGTASRHSLAGGITERTWPQETPLCTFKLAQTRWPVDALEGRRHEGS